MSEPGTTDLESPEIVAKALINAKEALCLSAETVGQIIGSDTGTVLHIDCGSDIADNKSLEAAVLFIRVYRALYALRGGNLDAMRHWLKTPNLDFGEKPPLVAMKHWAGLVDVVQYLDVMHERG